MRKLMRSLGLAAGVVFVGACDTATTPAGADTDQEREIMPRSERPKQTDSRVDVTTTSDGTVVITKIIGNTDFIWLSEDGQEGERVAIGALPDYFARQDPKFKAVMDRINSDPVFRQKILADDDESRRALRELIDGLSEQDGDRKMKS